MFEHLAKWPRILVTGPQRSGTRIAARMIAHDTQHWFVGEEEFGVDSLNRLWKLLGISHSIVVQCPALSAYVHLLGAFDHDLLVIMMRRGLLSIRASEKRIGWRWGRPELFRYDCQKGNPAQVKYRFWDAVQRADLGDRAVDLYYYELRRHPLWRGKMKRLDFAPRETG